MISGGAMLAARRAYTSVAALSVPPLMPTSALTMVTLMTPLAVRLAVKPADPRFECTTSRGLAADHPADGRSAGPCSSARVGSPRST
jgi:hypothetical protein